MNNKNTRKIMNQAVADLSCFSAVIHQTHWYMRNIQFLSLHPKMDEFMEEVNEQIDEIAERLIIVGGAPYSTLEEFRANSKIEEKKGEFCSDIKGQMERLLVGYKYLSNLYCEGIKAAEDENDPVTADMFTTLKAVIDKKVWMLSAVVDRGSQE